MRDAHSHGWFDYDLSGGISLPGAFTNTDFDNHGSVSDGDSRARVSKFLDVNLGGVLQFGHLGVGVTADFQRFSPASGTSETANVYVGRLKGLVAYGLMHGQVVVGLGDRIGVAQITAGDKTLLNMTGASPEVGALVMPTGWPFRLGATLRAPVTGKALGVEQLPSVGHIVTVGGYVTPQRIVMPWEAEAGFAYQLGPRPLNPGWKDPEEDEAPIRQRILAKRNAREADNEREIASLPVQDRPARARELSLREQVIREIEDRHLDEESTRLDAVRVARYRNWPREKILILGSVLVTGTSSDAVSLEGFLTKTRESVGKSLSYTPRLGLEGEPVHDRLLVRAGTYIEPSRYDGGTARQHFTFGGDVKLFPFDLFGFIPSTLWKTSVFVDIAPRYVNGGIGFGVWH